MNYKPQIQKYIETETEVLRKLDLKQIEAVIHEILAVNNRDGTIYIFGNGGSAATASHFANDLGRGVSERLYRKIRCICLNDNVPTILAIANDHDYEEIFRLQLKGHVRKEDLVIGISGSGNSMNIVNAIAFAKDEGVRTIGLVGFDGGKVKQIADLSFHVPIMDMQITEDVHMILDHLIMSVLLKEFRNRC